MDAFPQHKICTNAGCLEKQNKQKQTKTKKQAKTTTLKQKTLFKHSNNNLKASVVNGPVKLILM